MVIRNILIGLFKRLFIKITPYESKRLQICNACEDKIKLGPEWICKYCGCPIKNKCRVKDEKCLIRKW